MTEVASVTFVDGDSGDEALAIVRVAGETVGLTLSLRSDGDVEVFLDATVLAQVIDALQKAQSMIDSGG